METNWKITLIQITLSTLKCRYEIITHVSMLNVLLFPVQTIKRQFSYMKYALVKSGAVWFYCIVLLLGHDNDLSKDTNQKEDDLVSRKDGLEST